MKRSIAIIISAIVLITGFSTTAQAESPAVLKARMAKRLPQVVSILKSGAAGENNKGYLTVRGSLSAKDAAAVKAENADRKAVYTIIAKKTKSSVSAVGKTRAASIRKSAAKGTWIQLASGAWKKS
ncbi:MAG: YdbL family protein [Akkermansiaceae bacterium]